MLYISRITVYIYIHCSIRICSVLDHFGYRVPDLNAWNHLTWYSEDRTLQWLQALRAEINPHHIRGHEFCHKEEDQSTLAITRAIMDQVGATITMQAVAISSTTAPAPGTSTAPTSSELTASRKNIPSSYQFVVSDSNADSNGIPQILSEDEATPPVSSDHPPVPKVTLKRKLKKKAKKAKDEVEDKATIKVPKIKKKKGADATKSSAKVGKLIVKLPLGQQQLPFSQQLQTMAAKQTEQSTTSETSCRVDDSSSDTQGAGDDSTHPSSSGNKTT